MSPQKANSNEGERAAPVGSPPIALPGTTAVEYHRAAILSWIEEIAPYGIFTTDSNLRIQSWNEWLEIHGGIAAPLAVGRSLLELFPDLVNRKLDEHFRRALSGEVIVLSAAFHDYLLPFPSAYRELGSSFMKQTARIAPLSYHSKLCGTITIIEDVSQRESQSTALARRHERDQLLSSCLAQLLRTRDPESVVRELFSKIAAHLGVHTFFNYLVEPDGQHLFLHAAAGIPEERMGDFKRVRLGDNLVGTVAAERRLIVANHLQSSENPHTAELKALGFRAAVCHPLKVGDRLIGALAFASRNRDTFKIDDLEFLETVCQYVAVALERAMTEGALRDAQHALKEHAQSLEGKVQERTARLQDTVAQLETFSYTVAHDLRAPIRALRGYTEMLLSEVDPVPPDRARQYLQRMNRAADRLDAMTRDLLQFSSVSRQEVQLSTINLDELIQDLRVLRPTLQEDILVITEPLHPVLANRTLLQQCLSNLFDNALKFVAPGTKPKIKFWTERVISAEKKLLPLSPQSELMVPSIVMNAIPPPGEKFPGLPVSKNERVRIHIEDNGIGIAEESRHKIFGIFERLHPADKYEGTGIGLAIVARAIQRMGGSYGVESADGSGSRFWVELLTAD